MDKVAYITGSSRGIGKALTELLLEKGFVVVGLSRTNDIQHANFQHFPLDLEDIESVRKFDFHLKGDTTLLVNNAGALGEVNAIGKIANDSICKTMNINTISPQILSNNFIKKFREQSGDFHVLNISSGAGKRPITSWATYCASKAALDLFSETIASEFEWNELQNWSIHSCAPGVVDTKMQEEIRSKSTAEFKDVEKFVGFHENGELFDPKMVAEKLFQVIDNPDKFNEVIISVRDF